MITIKFGEQKINKAIFVVLLWVLVFQSPLELMSPAFIYVDEVIALLGILYCCLPVFRRQNIRVSRSTYRIVIGLYIYGITGLLGNILFQFQVLEAVLIDIFTNFKFFFAICAGYHLTVDADSQILGKTVNKNTRIISLFLFVIFLADRIFNIYPGEIRYGIKSAQLFFFHPTYFAGAMGFLLILLTVFFEKKNTPYIVIVALMMAFSMRSKAIASAAAYMLIFFYVIQMRQKFKKWYLVVCGILCIIIGWPLIQFYYVTLAGRSTRSVMMQVSFKIMKDYFPIGTGFGTFASAAANEYFSKVYELYNLEHLLRFDISWRYFLSDTFWPIIFAQTGVTGLLVFVYVLYMLMKRCFTIRSVSPTMFVGAIYVFVYLLISSTSEPAFHNSVAIPMAFILGIVFRESNHMLQKEML